MINCGLMRVWSSWNSSVKAHWNSNRQLQTRNECKIHAPFFCSCWFAMWYYRRVTSILCNAVLGADLQVCSEQADIGTEHSAMQRHRLGSYAAVTAFALHFMFSSFQCCKTSLCLITATVGPGVQHPQWDPAAHPHLSWGDGSFSAWYGGLSTHLEFLILNGWQSRYYGLLFRKTHFIYICRKRGRKPLVNLYRLRINNI